jgi:1-deoxy-D-xylulose-5-phosphate synthase
MLDRAGLTGPDGPTHHGCFDLAYLRVFPNLVVMAPGDAHDLEAMLDFALRHDAPCSLRYPKANAERLPGERAKLELGRAEVFSWGRDGNLLCAGTLLADCLVAAESLREEGLDVGVINARFVKPLDSACIERALRDGGFLVTVEEGCLPGGFGSAVLATASERGLDANRIRRLGIPDRFIEHAERGELLADLGLSPAGIARTCRELAFQDERGALTG